jgi:hypothetical protein
MTRLGIPERVIDASRVGSRVKHTNTSTHRDIIAYTPDDACDCQAPIPVLPDV